MLYIVLSLVIKCYLFYFITFKIKKKALLQPQLIQLQQNSTFWGNTDYRGKVQAQFGKNS